MNNDRRIKCSINKDKLDAELLKLMINSNFGKQIENVTKYKDTRIANNVDKAKKIASKVTLNNQNLFHYMKWKNPLFYLINQ